MGRSMDKLGVAASLLACFSAVNAQADSAGATWNHEDYTTSPEVFPSRKQSLKLSMKYSNISQLRSPELAAGTLLLKRPKNGFLS